jgi:hypothetical protein
VSIVMEMDNSALVSVEGAMLNIASVLDHVREAELTEVKELIVPYATNDPAAGAETTAALKRLVDRRADGIEFIPVPVVGGRYYDLKNTAGQVAGSELIVFIDSDCQPMPGWLDGLTEPFEDPVVVAAYGHTSFRTNSLVAKVMATCWRFPPPGSPASEAVFVSNNLALRGSWFRDNPFPENDGFKVAGLMLLATMREQGLTATPADARVEHEFWSTTPRGVLWRAAVSGRDTARRSQARQPGRGAGLRAAAITWARRMVRTVVRVPRYSAAVGLRPWQVPFAMAIGLAFWTIAGASQASVALGLTRERREHIPDHVSDS